MPASLQMSAVPPARFIDEDERAVAKISVGVTLDGLEVDQDWTPYCNAAPENPVVAHAVGRFGWQKLCRKMYTLRWSAIYPFQRRVVISEKFWCTVGELLVLPIVLGLILQPVWKFTKHRQGLAAHIGEVGQQMPGDGFGGDDKDMGSRAVHDTGGAPLLALVIAFSTAMHNSVWTFLLGLPFERALAYHKLFALLTIALGAFHGCAALPTYLHLLILLL
jgi:hypothetical protein